MKKVVLFILGVILIASCNFQGRIASIEEHEASVSYDSRKESIYHTRTVYKYKYDYSRDRYRNMPVQERYYSHDELVKRQYSYPSYITISVRNEKGKIKNFYKITNSTPNYLRKNRWFEWKVMKERKWEKGCIRPDVKVISRTRI